MKKRLKLTQQKTSEKSPQTHFQTHTNEVEAVSKHLENRGGLESVETLLPSDVTYINNLNLDVNQPSSQAGRASD